MSDFAHEFIHVASIVAVYELGKFITRLAMHGIELLFRRYYHD